MALTAYTFNANQVRVIEIESQPWFVAADACRILGLTGYASKHTARLSADEKGVLSAVQNGRDFPELFGPKVPTTSVVSESGLYKLIMRSDKPQARPFQDWVTKTVLPALRKDGMYVTGEEKVATGEMARARPRLT